MRKWGFSCWDLLQDPVGRDHFRSFLEKEYATENLLFVEAVWGMKKLAQKDVAEECSTIWKQFLGETRFHLALSEAGCQNPFVSLPPLICCKFTPCFL